MITFLEGRGELVDFDRNKKKKLQVTDPSDSVQYRFKL